MLKFQSMGFVLLSLACGSAAFAQLDRDDFVSDASHIVGTYEPAESDHSIESMTEAATGFLDSLDEELRKDVSLGLLTDERREWTNLPARRNAGGVTLKRLNELQLKKCCDLMATLLSEQGYAKMRNIMLADDTLLNEGRPRPGFGTDNFSVVLFGEPSTTGQWAFQLDGHHVGVNVSLEGEKLTMSPSFIGTQPAAFELGEEEVHPMAKGVDAAYQLAMDLNDEQRRKAVTGNRRGRILTGPGADGVVPKSAGLACSELNSKQRELLMSLIGSWVHDMPKAHADKRMAELRKEVDQISFSWNGETDKGSDVSWRIQGPTLIIEYACQDLGGDPLDHLHSMYRNPANEYGGQLDKED